MLRHYLTITLRHFRKDALHRLINIFGLSLGLLCAILIGLYIQYERSYDRHHPQPDRTYRVVMEANARTPPPLGAAMVREFPEVEATASLMPTFNGWLMRYEDKVFYESWVFQVSGDVFGLFTFPLVKGNPETALANPASGRSSVHPHRTWSTFYPAKC